MCTIILASRMSEDAPLLFAANRDEKLDRPAAGPSVDAERTPSVLAPRDLQEGGTWLGVNEAGLLVAITNRFGNSRDPSKKSRGYLVFEALTEETPRAAAGRIAGLAADDYNPFHLIFADTDSALSVWSDGDRMHHRELAPGFHILTERSYGAADSERETFLRRRLDAMRDNGDIDIESLQDLLSVRKVGSFDCTCVLVPDYDYGTRSSTILRLGEDPLFLYADGPPCETDYDDRTELLHELL